MQKVQKNAYFCCFFAKMGYKHSMFSKRKEKY